ncbi:uncharacterized protein GLRG_02461 [Colletotrichum graminicola M1.001]|uniref:Protein NO VEIN C-terminal domain-containing protein n=1 Tax=Colletotrichum graminicola (strain M1.001 / M2 / FGSC 10212) TaxID=645133 RepID=E3Q703_COLGM|nr:uncharacterized protein GLRG_02461 [Colletotrichum graminicola M1.001]EFQ26641.1 hypothetical protein GLRG_02461 [Colletotrichum graminicola M1.001]
MITEINDVAQLRELEVLSRLPITSRTLEDARRAYQYMAQNRRLVSTDTCMTFKSEKKLVYHPSRGWLSLQDCVWKSANPLKSTTTLADVYPECDDFFRGVLSIQDAGISEVVEELKRISNTPESSQEVESMKSIMFILCDYLAEAGPMGRRLHTKEKDEVLHLQVFPVVKSSLQPHDSGRAARRILDETWYIADRTALREAFLGKVEILDFDINDVDKLLPLIEWLDLDKRRLSKAVEERTVCTGSTVMQNEWSLTMQKRVRFLFLLGGRKNDVSDTFLPPVDVWKVSGLELRRRIGDIQGESGISHISIKEAGSRINVFVLRHPFENSPLQVDMKLSAFFIRWCSIKKDAHFKLVPLILKATPHETRGLLEDNNIRCPFSEDANYAADGSLTEIANHLTAVMDAHEAAIAEANSRFKEIGRQAEAYVDGFFKKHIPDWNSETHWTSHLRESFGYPTFPGDESTTADFTYTDEGGTHMLPKLQELGILKEMRCTKATKYHFEVKGTVFGCDEAFHLSQNQMELARKYARKDGMIPADIYIIARVYNVERGPEVRFYTDPWTKIFKGELSMAASGTAFRITRRNVWE